jgi:hypothetical protein
LDLPQLLFESADFNKTCSLNVLQKKMQGRAHPRSSGRLFAASPPARIIRRTAGFTLRSFARVAVANIVPQKNMMLK